MTQAAGIMYRIKNTDTMHLVNRIIREIQLRRHYPGNRQSWRAGASQGPLHGRTFRLNDRALGYYLHPYNNTWDNERAIELPVAFEFIGDCPPEEMLEVGNVTSHYIDSPHMVLDRYERCFYRKVINQDIMDFQPARKFRRILAISTLEHVGWDESPRDPSKIHRALAKFRDLLAPGGSALITIPSGYNSYLDDCLRDNRIHADQIECLRRYSAINEWEQVDLKDALDCRYAHPYPNANGIVFLTLRAPA